MLTLRQRVFIIISVTMAIILAILLYLLYGRKLAGNPADSETESGLNPKTSAQNPTVNEKTSPTEPSKPIIALPAYSEDMYLRQLAAIFTERFASYSTQNNNRNITDSLELTTPKMQTWMKALMKPNTLDYEGVTTEVLASSIKEKYPESATVAIQVQQTYEQKQATSTGVVSKEIRQKKGTVTLVKLEGLWKIDGLYWE